jgi:hypothetical protein
MYSGTSRLQMLSRSGQHTWFYGERFRFEGAMTPHRFLPHANHPPPVMRGLCPFVGGLRSAEAKTLIPYLRGGRSVHHLQFGSGERGGPLGRALDRADLP